MRMIPLLFFLLTLCPCVYAKGGSLHADTFNTKKSELRDYRSLNFGRGLTSVQGSNQQYTCVIAVGMAIASITVSLAALYLQEVSRVHTAGIHNP